MKSAEELWDKNKSLISDFNDEKYYILFQSKFYDALAEHDKEIIAMIDEMIEKYKIGSLKWNYLKAKVQALTELKNFILNHSQ